MKKREITNNKVNDNNNRTKSGTITKTKNIITHNKSKKNITESGIITKQEQQQQKQ